MPLFFSRKSALDVNGTIILSHFKNNKILSRYRSLPPLTTDIVRSTYKVIGEKQNSSITKDLGNYILFYGRQGNWKFSSKHSKRNMPQVLFIKLISKLLEKQNVVIIGDTKLPVSINNSDYSNKIYFINELLDKNYSLYEIYSNTSFVIGSCSGATHFPSMLFNKETLYITDVHIRSLDALYLVPTKFTEKKFKLDVPSKDKWIITPFKELSKKTIIKSILSMTEDFINKKQIKKYKNYTNYKYMGPFKKAGRTLYENQAGNILLHKDVPINTKLSDFFNYKKNSNI